MNSQLTRCRTCGTPRSAWLDGNCPNCLISLGGQSDTDLSGGTLGTTSANLGEVRYLGDYELLEEIARGGMGAVFRAHQISLDRMVALKVLLAGEFAEENALKRFRREAKAAASLEHPNIVSIYEVGEHEGRAYFSMELIEGQDLAELTRDKPLPARQAAQLLKTIAEAVHYAHERRVIHRDLKPSNVLVDSHGVPHITDFGLAKGVEQGADLTLNAQVLGTPSYMPPEQAEPKRGQITRASDVYSLGAVLYHLLTARPPFMAETITQTLRLVSEGDAVSPRRLNPGVPRDLETICIKCLDRDPNRRFATAQELADELDRYLMDEPIRARPVGATARVALWCRRKPALAVALGAVVVLLLVVALGSPMAVVRIDRARQLAEAAKAQTQQQLYTALLEQARATVHSGELGQRVRALDAVRRAAAITNTPELRQEALAALALPDLRFEQEMSIDSDFTFAQLDPPFARTALGRGSGPVEIRSMSDQRLLATLPASSNLVAFAGKWSSDGLFLAVNRSLDPGDKLAEIEVWNVTSARRVLLLHGAARGALAYHPHEEQVLAAPGGKQAATWDLRTGAEIRRFDLADKPVHLRFSPDGKRFAAEYHSPTNDLILVYDADTGKPLSSTHLAEMVRDIDWDPRGRWIALADVRGDVHLTDSESGHVRTLGRHKLEGVTTIFSPKGDFLFSGGLEQVIVCWDMGRMQPAFKIGPQISRVQFRADGHECAITTPKGVQRFAFERPAALRELNAERVERLHRGTFSRDGRWLVVTGRDRLGLWDWAADPAPIVKVYAEASAPLTVDPNFAIPFLTPDDSELFASWNNGIGRWRFSRDSNGAAVVQPDPLPVHNPRRLSSSFLYSNDLVRIGVGGAEFVNLTNVATGRGRLYETYSGFGCVSPDGRWLALRTEWQPWVLVYRLPEMTLDRNIVVGADVMTFAFAPQSDELVVATRAAIEFYATTTWQRARLLPMPMDRYSNLLFAPDGRNLWVSRDNRIGALYNTRTLEMQLPLPTGTLPLAVSPDGRNLAVSVDGRGLQVWDVVEMRRQFRELGVDWENAR